MEVKLLQPKKQASPKLVTELGMVMEVKAAYIVFVYHFISINYVLNGRKVKMWIL